MALARGTIVRWWGAVADIGGRQRIEQALRRSEAYLAEAQRLSHTGSWAYDVAKRHLVYCSDENFRLFGYDPASDLPSNAEWAARFHPEDREMILETMRRQLEHPSAYVLDYRVLHPDGTIKFLHSVAHPVFNSSGELVEFVGTHVDMTDRKQAEQARLDAQTELTHANRVATIGQLTASIAHEVNQPIGALVTNAHAALRLLKADPPDLVQVSEALDDIIADGRRVSKVIDRIRALVKKRRREIWPLDINEVILETIALTRGEVLKSDISLEVQLARDLPVIQGDRIQLQQLVTNLMMNAIEAMSTAEISNRNLQIDSRTEIGDQILLTVCDSGPKLTAECLDRFFDAFYSTKSNGIGIGLSICRSIVETHGGQIWATANADRGVTLHVSLPILREPDSSQAR
jgi:PAS domain S-box-containing protein